MKMGTVKKVKTWRIEVRDETIYRNIEAETEEEAIKKALELWVERQPRVICDPQ